MNLQCPQNPPSPGPTCQDPHCPPDVLCWDVLPFPLLPSRHCCLLFTDGTEDPKATPAAQPRPEPRPTLPAVSQTAPTCPQPPGTQHLHPVQDQPASAMFLPLPHALDTWGLQVLGALESWLLLSEPLELSKVLTPRFPGPGVLQGSWDHGTPAGYPSQPACVTLMSLSCPQGADLFPSKVPRPLSVAAFPTLACSPSLMGWLQAPATCFHPSSPQCCIQLLSRHLHSNAPFLSLQR